MCNRIMLYRPIPCHIYFWDYSCEQCDKRALDCLSIIKESGTKEIDLSQDVLNEMRNQSSSVYNKLGMRSLMRIQKIWIKENKKWIQ